MPDDQLTFVILAPVTLKVRWGELLGRDAADMSAAERRRRWEQWKALCAKADPHCLSVWTDNAETCDGCRHRDGDWCGLMELPTNVNPILTIRHGTMGMACMGGWYETADGRRETPEQAVFIGPPAFPF